VCARASTGRGNRTHAKTNVHVGLQNSSTVSEEFGQVGLGFSSHQVDCAPKQPKKNTLCVVYVMNGSIPWKEFGDNFLSLKIQCVINSSSCERKH
jgi:hypothetical protein